MRKIINIGLISVIGLILYFALFKGFNSDGMICVVLDVDGSIPSDKMTERIIKIKDDSTAKITAITSSEVGKYRIHMDIRCETSSHFSLTKKSMQTIFLTSYSELEKAIRTIAAIPDDADSMLSCREHFLP